MLRTRPVSLGSLLHCTTRNLTSAGNFLTSPVFSLTWNTRPLWLQPRITATGVGASFQGSHDTFTEAYHVSDIQEVVRRTQAWNVFLFIFVYFCLIYYPVKNISLRSSHRHLCPGHKWPHRHRSEEPHNLRGRFPCQVCPHGNKSDIQLLAPFNTFVWEILSCTGFLRYKHIFTNIILALVHSFSYLFDMS